MTIFSLTDFQDKLRIADYTLELGENLVSSQSGAGIVSVAQVGPRLWRGSINVVANTHDEMRRMLALVRYIQNAGNYFTFSPPKHDYPRDDAGGVRIAGYSPSLNNPVAGYSATFKSLPANYTFKAGDYFSFAKSGTNRLHQIAADATANGSGNVTVAMVNPFRANAVPSSSTPVRIVRPILTCQYVPGSFKTGSVLPGYAEAFSFDFVQALVAS